ncbi:hypothetical protein EUGRSUZ_E01738 [Eucalyptus grandis]|uniref:3-hydroxyisobutyryl-CoA hydrolase n=2 Tax=Eucalyptus grandis TaxID=71139 RepID=A0A059C489_EUCGR|nr:hypothetical protein EUGRSUZ_E01738 [Eucalyptus grandis]
MGNGEVGDRDHHGKNQFDTIVDCLRECKINSLWLFSSTSINIYRLLSSLNSSHYFCLCEEMKIELLSLEAALHSIDSSDQAIISAVIGEYSELPMLQDQSAYNRLDVINRCFSRRTVEDVLYALIREGRLQGVGQCLVREHRIDCHAMRGEVSKDFVEGCRAVILDKDRNPKWEPTRLGLVTDKMVDVYFSKVDDEDWEELKLPPRPNLPASAFAKL